jgi:trigger factor
LISDKIVRENNIEVKPEEIKAFAKQQLFGYMNMPMSGDDQPWVIIILTK